MAIGAVGGGSDSVRVQNAQAEARAENERRQAQAARQETDVRPPREPNRGQNTDVTV